MSTALELSHVSFSYDGKHDVLQDISLTVPRGQWLTIVGANGSGKSTLSRLLSAVSAPTSGTLTVLGNTLFDTDGVHRDAYIRARHGLSYVTQNPEDHIVGATVKDDVAFEPENLGFAPCDTASAVQHALGQTGMLAFSDTDPQHLSGGQQQRVAIASALAASPDLLILDEPFAYVDMAARRSILSSLSAQHSRGVTIIIITHHESVAALGERVITLGDGRIVQDGKPTSASADESISAERIPVPVQNEVAQPVLAAKNLTYAYDGRSVLENVNVSVARGEFVTLSGPNGTGKSTLAHLLAGAFQPTSGSVISHAERIGLVLQKPEKQLFAESVREDIAFGPRNLGLSAHDVDERVMQTAEFLGITHLLERPVWNLSGGQQRLVAIAGTLAMKPDVLILDEPTAGLDTHVEARLLSVLEALHEQGMTILMITHSLAHIRQLATRAILLEPPSYAADPSVTPEDTVTAPLSRFDPRALTTVTLLTLFTSFALHTPAQLGLGVLVALAYVLLAHIRPGELVTELHGFWIFIAFMGLFNLFFVQSGAELVRFGAVRLTDAGVWAGVLYAGRFALLAVVAVSVLHILPPARITDAVESLCGGLKRLGWPVHELSLMMSLSLRFIPILTRDVRSLITAQELRGGTIRHGSLAVRARSAQALIVPSFANALRHADKLSVALDIRGFDSAATRVPWRVMRMTARDWALVAAFVVYLAAVVALYFV
ncbi:hypothetical protein B9G54_03035 [Alloscardovia macacae]|uniref:energy-coupling factor transporter ATPase n=1 Tax=Alloscardovia macacae TaxID=1160091 RepID=UPI000A2D5E3B|nr:energy-coupling factor transporter ATPase [Alloscardovia macacae]OTA27016.1 hypothetical protein B9G54_03035 [Alloscardovia macacae]